MKFSFRHVLGSFRLLRRRVREVGQPGLAVWTDAGERAAVHVGARVRDETHRAEVEIDEVERELRAIVADGRVTPAELRRLKTLAPRLQRAAGECHDAGEAVRS